MEGNDTEFHCFGMEYFSCDWVMNPAIFGALNTDLSCADVFI